MDRKKIACFGILLCALAGLSAGCSSGNQDIRNITAEESDSLYIANRGNPDFVVVDVRTPEEWSRARIEGSINIDQMADTFPDEIDKLDKTRLYLIYCTDAKRSVEALALMKQKGFKTVYEIEGGVIAWALAGYPVERVNTVPVQPDSVLTPAQIGP